MNVLYVEALRILHDNMNVITKAELKKFFSMKCILLKVEYFVNIHRDDEYKKLTIYKIEYNEKGKPVTSVFRDNIII